MKQEFIWKLVLCCGIALSLQYQVIAATLPSPIDSLFQQIEQKVSFSAMEANELFRLLNEEEYIDSLYCFPVQASVKEMRLPLYTGMAYYLYDQENYQKALSATVKALGWAKEEKDTMLQSDLLAHKGTTLLRLGEIDEGIEAMLGSMRLDSIKGKTECFSSSYNNLAAAYLMAKRPEVANQLIEQAIEMEKSLLEPTMLSIRYGMSAEIKVQLNRLDEALAHATLAYEIDSVQGNTLRMARRLSQMGDIYSAMHQMEKAECCYLRSVALLEPLSERTSLSINYKQLGKLYMQRNETDKAICFLEKSVLLAEETGNNYILKLVYELLYTVYRNKQPARALTYLEKFTQLKDSAYTEKTNQLLSDYEVKYQTAQKELTIQQQTLELQEKCFELVISMTGLFLLFIVALVLFFYFTRYRRLAMRERKLNQQQQRLISILSHDIKNPLITLTASLRALDNSSTVQQSAELREQSAAILTAMEQQQWLVGD